MRWLPTGVFAWHDGRQNADTFQALFEYPKGFLVSYSTSFGNDAPSFPRYMGKQRASTSEARAARVINMVQEKGTHEDDADIDLKRASEYVLPPGESEDKLPPMGIDDLSLGHVSNWFECMRSRQQPHATVHAGLAHSAACMMATEAYWSSKRQYWDRTRETVTDQAPKR